MKAVAGAAGRAIIRASRWIQAKALGLRVPAYRLREDDLERQIFQADERIRIGEAELAYWRAHLAVLERDMDHAWRASLDISRKIDAARGIVQPLSCPAVKESPTAQSEPRSA